MEALLSLVAGTEQYIILLFIFLAAAMVVGSIALIALNRDIVAERLAKLVPAGITGTRVRIRQEESTGLVAKVAKPLHKLAVPTEEEINKKIRLKLIQAGLRSREAYRNFLAAKVACFILFPSAYIFRSLFISIDLQTVLVSIFLAAVGYYLPELFILQLKQKRQQTIFKAVPDALDLMVICTEAGLGLDMTFKRVGEEIRSLSKDLSDEFLLTNLEVRAGKPREDALRNMAMRTGVPEVQNLTTVLIQTSRFGTNLAKALRVHADSMRTKRRQMAEEIAAKSAVKLLFPLLLFIFPVIFVVLLGPAAIQVMRNLLPVLGGN